MSAIRHSSVISKLKRTGDAYSRKMHAMIERLYGVRSKIRSFYATSDGFIVGFCLEVSHDVLLGTVEDFCRNLKDFAAFAHLTVEESADLGARLRRLAKSYETGGYVA